MIHAKIAFAPETDPRAEERVPVAAEVTLGNASAQWEDARLVNISSRGFMAESPTGVFPGSRVWLLLPGVGRVNAQVIWVRGDRLGGSFTDPVDPLRVLQAVGEQSAA